jgi:tRNA (guanine-N7-)-methyltransferase
VTRVRIRQHVNPLLSFFDEFRGERPVLEAGRPVEVEIGCADAQFLFERAAMDPGRTYVGLEIREELVDLVNKRARQSGAPVVAVFCQAQKHLGEIFPAASVDRVYINFPDPWFKTRHANRRMVDDVLVVGVAGILRSGADVLVQSDVWDVALDAMEWFERRDELFANLAGPWTFWREGNPYGVRSWREQNAEETGLPIWRIRYRRR